MSGPNPTIYKWVNCSLESLQEMIDNSFRQFREELVRDLRFGDLGEWAVASSTTESQSTGNEEEETREQTSQLPEQHRTNSSRPSIPDEEHVRVPSSDILDLQFGAIGYFDPDDDKIPSRRVGTDLVFADVHVFIRRLRDIVNRGYSERQISILLPQLYRGEARRWWLEELTESQQRRYLRSLEDITNELYARFRMSPERADMIIEQSSWSIDDAGTVSIYDFAARIRRAAWVMNLGHDEALLMVWNRLHPQVQNYVDRPDSDTDLNLWMERLGQCEEFFKVYA